MHKIIIDVDPEILASFKAMQEKISEDLEPLEKFSKLFQTAYSEKFKAISEAFLGSVPNSTNYEARISKISIPEIPDISTQVQNLFEESYFEDIGSDDRFVEKKQKIGFKQPYSDNR